MSAEGEPATIIYGRTRPKVVHGHLTHRAKRVAAGWLFVFASPGVVSELFLRDEEEGTGWSRGHHDGKDLLAACLLQWSAQ